MIKIEIDGDGQVAIVIMFFIFAIVTFINANIKPNSSPYCIEKTPVMEEKEKK